jgi:hypothetical protein
MKERPIMPSVRSFVRFWIDFIIGDAWEVAAGLALTLVVIAIVADRTGARVALSFVLVAAVLLFTGIALRRASAKTS